jgi:hypothetical protein
MKFDSKANRLHWLPEWQIRIVRTHPSPYLKESPDILTSYEQCPERFREVEDFTCLQYGYECEAGWAQLLNELSAAGTALVKALRTFGFQYDAKITAYVVKEKFGILHFQGHHNLLPPFANLWRSYVSWIEKRSSHTCEVSGKFGELRHFHGWFKTQSDAGYEKTLLRRAKRQSGRESDACGGEAAK